MRPSSLKDRDGHKIMRKGSAHQDSDVITNTPAPGHRPQDHRTKEEKRLGGRLRGLYDWPLGRRHQAASCGETRVPEGDMCRGSSAGPGWRGARKLSVRRRATPTPSCQVHGVAPGHVGGPAGSWWAGKEARLVEVSQAQPEPTLEEWSLGEQTERGYFCCPPPCLLYVSCPHTTTRMEAHSLLQCPGRGDPAEPAPLGPPLCSEPWGAHSTLGFSHPSSRTVSPPCGLWARPWPRIRWDTFLSQKPASPLPDAGPLPVLFPAWRVPPHSFSGHLLPRV